MTPTIVHRSKSQGALLERLATVARCSAEILILGPSGVGKELYAAYIHAKSPRAAKPFVVVNCANFSAEMIENEIFGHARGAFTGAVTSVDGIAAAADGGTLFLDEIDALPLPCQAKLLRFAHLREYRRLGEAYMRKSDVRLITASNADLLERVRAGSFRQDLYFRIRVVPVEIPPLADRREDIPALIQHFTAVCAREYGLARVSFAPAAEARLLAYDWPGNVRELENTVRYLTCLALDRPVRPEDLPLIASPALPPPVPTAAGAGAEDDGAPTLANLPLKEAKSIVIEGLERAYLHSALRDTSGNVAEAARRSGKHPRAFFELMRRYGVTAGVYRP